MYYFDDYPCGHCPYNEPAYGHCAYDEDCCFEDEESDLDYYLDDCDDCDAPPAIVITPRPADDLDDLPF